MNQIYNPDSDINIRASQEHQSDADNSFEDNLTDFVDNGEDLRIISAKRKDDEHLDKAMRPKRLEDYVGQAPIRNKLEIYIKAARQRGEALDHLLFFGPPGLGKTTIANIIANEMGVDIKHTSGPVLERAGDLAALLTNLGSNDVLFIDEIHRLSPQIEEILYPAMEDCQIDIMIGEGPAARSIKLDLPPFTLIGATTRAGMLTSPLRDRFGICERLQFYSEDELALIVKRSANLLNVEVEPVAAMQIAKRARGTPRIVNRLLRRVRDFAQVEGNGIICAKTAVKALNVLEVDEQGFDELDRKLLQCLVRQFDGGPVGIDSLAQALGDSKETLQDVFEPYLIQKGFMLRTPRGRVATLKTYEYLGLAMPQRLLDI